MHVDKLIILIPLSIALLTRFIDEKRVKYINFLMSIVIPSLMGYQLTKGFAFDIHLWVYAGGYFILSSMLLYNKSGLKGRIELFQILYAVTLMVIQSDSKFFAIMGTIGSSFILLLLFFRQQVAFKCKHRIVGFAAYNIIADSFLFLYLVLNSVPNYSSFSGHMLTIGIFVKILQLPYLFCLKSEEGRGFLVNVLYFPLTILMLSSYLFVNFHVDNHSTFDKAIVSSIILVILIAYSVYSILVNDLRDSFSSIASILSIKSFLVYFVLGAGSLNPALESVLMISAVFVFYFIWGEIAQVFGNAKIFSIYGAKEKLTFVFFALLVFFYLSFGFWGTVPYFQNMMMISYFLDTSIPYISVITMSLYGALIFTTIASMTKIFSVIFLRNTEVPWCSPLEGGRVLGSKWPYTLFLSAVLAYMIFLNVTAFSSAASYSTALVVMMSFITVLPLVLFFYISVFERVKYEDFSTSLFENNDFMHDIFCIDRIIDLFASMNIVAVKHLEKIALYKIDIVGEKVSGMSKLLTSRTFSNDSVVVVMILASVGAFVCFIV